MNTFHIQPGAVLAPEAVISVIELIAKHGNDVLVAIRGESVYDHEDEDLLKCVYTDRVYAVTEAPHDCRENGGDTDYLWEYVSASDWLAEHRRHYPPTKVVLKADGITAVMEYPVNHLRIFGQAGVQVDGSIDPVQLMWWIRSNYFSLCYFPANQPRPVRMTPDHKCYLQEDPTLHPQGGFDVYIGSLLILH